MVALALALRVLVPGGFMPVVEHGVIVVQICNGSQDGPGMMAIAMPGMKHAPDPAGMAAGKCAYADLAQVMTGGADPILLGAALAFALSLALSIALTLPPRETGRLRPPLRGPPAAA